VGSAAFRKVIGAIWIFHGLGHLLPFLPLFGIRLGPDHNMASWLLTGPLANVGTYLLGPLLWIITVFAFIGAGLAINGRFIMPARCVSLAVTASVLSLLGLLLFWNAFPMLVPNKTGVFLVDVLTLVLLVGLRWQPCPHQMVTPHQVHPA